MSSRSARNGVRLLRLAARAQNRRALRPFARVKAAFTLAKDRRDSMQPMRAQPEGNKAAPGFAFGTRRGGSKIRPCV